jgi:hypothetical protein
MPWGCRRDDLEAWRKDLYEKGGLVSRVELQWSIDKIAASFYSSLTGTKTITVEVRI